MQNAPYPALLESCFSRSIAWIGDTLKTPLFSLSANLGGILSQRYATENPCGVGWGRSLYSKLHSQNRIKHRMCRASNCTTAHGLPLSVRKWRHQRLKLSTFPLSIRVQTKANNSRFVLTELRSSLGVFSFQILLRSSKGLSRRSSLPHQRKIDAARGGSVRWGWIRDILYTTMPRETSEHNC